MVKITIVTQRKEKMIIVIMGKYNNLKIVKIMGQLITRFSMVQALDI